VRRALSVPVGGQERGEGPTPGGSGDLGEGHAVDPVRVIRGQRVATVQQVRMTQEDDLLQVVATSRGRSDEDGGYVAKPFNMNELLAAKQVILKAPCRLGTTAPRSPPSSST
jgi:DNA-binding response OmpR family regulator